MAHEDNTSLAPLYESTETRCYFDVSLGVSRPSFLYDGQETIRRAILYGDRSFYCPAISSALYFFFWISVQ